MLGFTVGTCAHVPVRNIKPGQRLLFTWEKVFWIYEQGSGHGLKRLSVYAGALGGELMLEDFPMQWSNGPADHGGKVLVWFADVSLEQTNALVNTIRKLPLASI